MRWTGGRLGSRPRALMMTADRLAADSRAADRHAVDPGALYLRAAARGFQPETALPVSQWAERYRILGQGRLRPGSWRNSRTPYLTAIMDCLSPASPIERVVVMKGAQLGYSEAGNNWAEGLRKVAGALRPGLAGLGRRVERKLGVEPFLKQRLERWNLATPARPVVVAPLATGQHTG